MLVASSKAEPMQDFHMSAHEGLGLGQPIRGLEQPGQVIKAYGEFRMLRTEAPLIDRQGAAQERLGLCRPVHVLEQLAQVVESGASTWVLGAIHRFGPRHCTIKKFPCGVELASMAI